MARIGAQQSLEGLLIDWSMDQPLPDRRLPVSLLSKAQFTHHLTLFIKLWSRGYGETRRVVLKATSSAGRMAIPLLEHSAQSRAIWMNLRVEPYLAALLAGQNSSLDLRGHGPGRIRRLQARLATPLTPLHALSIGEMAAMSWLAESWTQRDAHEKFRDRLITIDFDEFLADVAQGMRRVLEHFGLGCDARVISGLLTSPVLTRYSKAPEYEYTARTRSELIDASRRTNREEIRRGIAWIDRVGRSSDAVAAIVNSSG